MLFLGKAHAETKPFLLFVLPHWQGAWGCMGNWEEVTQTDQRDIPDLMTSSSEYKMGGRRWRCGTFGVMAFVFSPGHG